jgi:serine protease SohB
MRAAETPFMAFWLDIAEFALKAALIVAALGALFAVVALIAGRMRGGESEGSRLTVRSLDQRYEAMAEAINAAILDKKALKGLAKARRREAKAAAKSGERAAQKRIFVLDFKGDVRARAVRRLAEEIDAALAVARPGTDEVAIRIESPGGTVTGYGLAAADRGVKVTACVDQVAASGGYLMACAADRIVAAPFALVGSIGVVAQIPNLHRLLKRNDIDYEEITAGEYKRSVSVLGEITPQGREHFRGKLDATHEAFKRFVQERRPGLDIAKVGDGDVWLASEALGLGLVDALMTSDAFLLAARGEARLYEIAAQQRKTLAHQLFGGLGAEARSALESVAARFVGAPK